MEALIILFLIVVFCLLLFHTPSKGAAGEHRIAKILQNGLTDDYLVSNDVTIPCQFGTTQIDHVVLSPYGIFIIETKNYSGWITGTGDAEYWTQNMYGKKYQFRNPVKQNYAHLKALQSLLSLDSYCFHPIVVFLNSAQLKNRCNGMVLNESELIHAITQYKAIVIPPQDIPLLSAKISQAALTDKDTKKQHVQNVRFNIYNRESKIREGICPRCGGSLVNRNGKYGTFLGCSNYPQCKFTTKVNTYDKEN